MQILDYNLVLTCQCCPEQYDVFDSDGKQVGYLRLRHGGFRADYPDWSGDTVYRYSFDEDAWKGMFNNEEEREFFLTEAVKALHNKIQLEKE
jgi:hypothetical protein